MMNDTRNTVTIPLYQYRILLDTKTRVDVLLELMDSKGYLTEKEVQKILTSPHEAKPVTYDDVAEALGYSD